jgi:hypothetical protein
LHHIIETAKRVQSKFECKKRAEDAKQKCATAQKDENKRIFLGYLLMQTNADENGTRTRATFVTRK